jgi:predicted ABC-type ATPase
LKHCIRRRYVAGILNMRRLYLPLADVAAIYDNVDYTPTLIAERAAGRRFTVRDPVRWARIESVK